MAAGYIDLLGPGLGLSGQTQTVVEVEEELQQSDFSRSLVMTLNCLWEWFGITITYRPRGDDAIEVTGIWTELESRIDHHDRGELRTRYGRLELALQGEYDIGVIPATDDEARIQAEEWTVDEIIARTDSAISLRMMRHEWVGASGPRFKISR